MLQISKWYGRFGNNVLQILRALHAAEQLGHKYITTPNHRYLKNRYEVQRIIKNNSFVISHTFFDLNDLGLDNPSSLSLKNLVNIYRKQLFHPHIYSEIYNNNIDNNMTIHVRGGDVFSRNPHPYYLQPPLYYYTKIIKSYDCVNLIKEDSKNPVVRPLKKMDTIIDISSSFLSDLSNLINSKSLVFSASTLPYVAYLLSHKIRSIYMPKYYYDALQKAPWPDNTKIILVKLKDYTENGSWKNTLPQREMILNYNTE